MGRNYCRIKERRKTQEKVTFISVVRLQKLVMIIAILYSRYNEPPKDKLNIVQEFESSSRNMTFVREI